MNPSILNSPPLTCHSVTEVLPITQPCAWAERCASSNVCVWGHACIRLLISGHGLQGDRSRDYNKAFNFRFYKAATSTRAQTHDSHAHSSLHHCHHTTLIVFRSKNKSPEKLPVADSHQWSRYQQSHCDRSLGCMFQTWRHCKEYFITERDKNISSADQMENSLICVLFYM